MKAFAYIAGLLAIGAIIMSNRKRAISKNGLELIKQYEGWSATIYKDVAGYPTIGYGHLIKAGESFTTITRAEGELLLRKDVKIAERGVNELVNVPLSQNMFDALVSFVYNVGAGAFKNSTLLKVLNAGDYQQAQKELARWNKAGGKINQGLINRREHEQQLFFA